MDQRSFFDRENRLHSLSQLGDPLERLTAAIPWERLRPLLEPVHEKARKSNAGRKPFEVAWSVAIFRATRKGIRPISGANNGATAIAFGGPRSSCVRPGAHSAAWHQDSRNDLTSCRMAWPSVSAGAHAPDSDQTLGPTPTRGGALPLGAYAPSLLCAPPLMFKTLVLQTLYNLADEQVEYRIRDRLSFCPFSR